jgi:crotonobetainyl-CoA:carnitine CoA-transferase CaiB-like acyl-CoA transferase
MYDYVGRGPFDEPSGREVKGAHAFYRCYQALDGWLFLALDRQSQLADLGRALQLPELATADQQVAEQCLESLFRSQTMGHWQALLAPVDIGCQPLGRMSQLRESSLMNEASGIDLSGPKTVAFIEYPEHPCGHRVELIAPNSIRLQRAPVRLPSKMAKYGSDTAAVLERLGCTAEEVDLMVEQGVAALQWTERYLPS